ncbi:DUF2202 domain-containing protein [Flavobacterium luminosum]|uniref:DUF2202 domain-containing protein n=1 Tax=Flavobacterium luminosum TaxID=2949086 RepID=A0ABT0TNQ0_9FLAO|nr:DUF2202 domain-containing protein [Flavobacterium sp. HXWNR70]MCL9808891.1 DUF2202 domain-containing protein [Flavobacterium sp. HXWNR70]
MKIKFFIIKAIMIVLFTVSCSDNEDNTKNVVLTPKEKEGVLFMLEEEKLARDTYNYMNNLWGLSLFNNIKNSEQSHMDAIVTILEQHNIEYTILPEGQFSNQNLQNFYNQFIIDGQVSSVEALKIGATIEDLDIVDLENYINESTNKSLILAYQNLQCGSRNHLRSFVSTLDNLGVTYNPQFLTTVVFNSIITSSHEQCN